MELTRCFIHHEKSWRKSLNLGAAGNPFVHSMWFSVPTGEEKMGLQGTVSVCWGETRLRYGGDQRLP